MLVSLLKLLQMDGYQANQITTGPHSLHSLQGQLNKDFKMQMREIVHSRITKNLNRKLREKKNKVGIVVGLEVVKLKRRKKKKRRIRRMASLRRKRRNKRKKRLYRMWSSSFALSPSA